MIKKIKTILFLWMILLFTNIALWWDVWCESHPEWDNDFFVNQTFWQLNPTTEQIVCAIFGNALWDWSIEDESAYTQNRDPNKVLTWEWRYCRSSNINVEILEKFDPELEQLTGNTIYVLTWSKSVQNNTIHIYPCTAIISKNQSWTTFYSNNYLNTGLFVWDIPNKSADANRWRIFDNIKIDGTNDWNGWSHTKNEFWINFDYDYKWREFKEPIIYTTINDTEIYNNKYWAFFEWNLSILLNNSFLYNNDTWLIILNSYIWNINNSQFYNNEYWVSFYQLTWWTINNSQIYNNKEIWAAMVSWNKNILWNSMLYNNSKWVLSQNWNQIFLSELNIYNNDIWVYSRDNEEYFYFHQLNLFGNDENFDEDWSPIQQWSGMTWIADGTIITDWTISFDFFTNPISYDQEYLLSWTDTWENLKYNNLDYNWKTTKNYSYWSGIIQQQQNYFFVTPKLNWQ